MRWVAIIACLCAGAAAADPRAEAVLGDLMAKGAGAVTFTNAFRRQVGRDEVDAIVDALRNRIGEIDRIEVDGTDYVIRSADWRLRGTIALDASGAISGLFFEPAERVGLDLTDATGALGRLGEDVAWLVTRDGETRAAERADTALPVGSAFKLAVLAELAARVAAGDMGWDDTVTLEERHRSLPSGDMRLWPAGSPVTLSTAAIEMIGASDNTATDLLIDLLGRDGIAARLGTDFVPSTREVFALAADGEAGAAYLRADAEARASIAAGAAREMPPLSGSEGAGPYAWPVSLRTLCDLARDVAGLPAMRVNTGPVPVRDWSDISFKGGSVAGVLNLTAAMEDASGRETCVAVTVNGLTAGDAEAIAAYRGLLAALGTE